MKKSFFLITFLLFLKILAAQSLRITGSVMDQEGRPVPGATLFVPRTGIRALTGTDGGFILEPIRPGDSIQVTATGYARLQVGITGNDALTLILVREAIALKEVILNTGYQQLPRERATGSFTIIDPLLFHQQVTSDILSRLEAISSGISVDRITGEHPKLQVRGISTIQGPRDPLVILDNFPYEGNISNINPNDVASISILKDAAAASIWGARAGNGVIVITTTKPRFNKSLSVQWNINTTMACRPDLYYMKEMTPADYIGVEQFLFSKNVRLSDTAVANKPPLTPVYEILLAQKNGQISQAEAERRLSILRQTDLRQYFDRYFYKPAFTRQVYLSLLTGAEVSALKFSIGYDQSDNELSAKNDRFNLRFEHQLKPFKTLQVNTGLYLTRTTGTNGKPAYGQLTTTNGLLPLYTRLADEAGNALPVMKDYRMPWADTAGTGRLLNWQYYPLEDFKFSSTNNTGYDLLFNTDITANITPWLSFTGRYQFEKQDDNTKSTWGAQSYFTRNLVNSFASPVPGSSVKFNIPQGAILDQYQSILNVHNLRGQFSLQHRWHDHDLSMIGGMELRQATSESAANRLYGYDPAILSITSVDYANPYPNYITGSLAYIPDNASLNDRVSRFVSVYTNAAYTLQGRYTASFSARRDGSNLLGAGTNEKWQPLWSAGLRWQLSDEKFAPFKKALKVNWRLTYGVSGNVDLSKTAVAIIGYTLNSPYTQTPQAAISQFANPELQWEKTYMLNTGLDFALLNNRLSGSVEYYHKRGMNLFGSAPIDYTGGAGTDITKNVASMLGNGIDLQLEATLLQKTFGWKIDFLYSRYKDRVTDYYLGSLAGHNFISLGRPRIAGVERKPVYSIFSYPWAGLDPSNGNPQGWLADKISTDYTKLTRDPLVSDLVYHGPALPVHFGSIGNTFTFKKLDLTVRMMYKLGYWFRRSSIEYNSLFNIRVGHQDYESRWQQPGDENWTNVPSMVYPIPAYRDAFYGGSATLIEKGDHLRLSYISAGYNLISHAKSTGIKSLRLYAVANNLGLIWKANHQAIDPDMPYAAILPPKNFSLGINTSF